MKSKLVQIGLMALAAGVLTACGGGGGGSAALPTPQPVGNVAVAVAAAGFTGGVSNATPTVNPKMVFQLATATPVTINPDGQPVVKFTVIDSSGSFVKGLKLSGGSTACGTSGSNIRFALAKYDGVDWWSLVSRRHTLATDNTKTVVEATTDPSTATLSENATDSFYTYTFATKVKTASVIANSDTSTVANNGQVVASDGKTIHRLALQLCYVDPVTQTTVKVNPYMDFTFAANDVGVPVKDTQGAFVDAKKVVDRASCNECHSDFAQHDGGRVDPNYCVVCHNAGSTDYNTGNPIDFKLMVHKFHMGKRLTQPYKVAKAGANDIVYPQNIKNCVVCHDGSATAKHRTSQGDNWISKASKSACFSCHDDLVKWQSKHSDSWAIAGLNVAKPQMSNDSSCNLCHNNAATDGVFSNGTAHPVNTASAHAIPQWMLGENYQLNILKLTLNPAPVGGKRSVTVRYALSNPKDGSKYDLAKMDTKVDISKLALLFSWNSADYSSMPVSMAASSGASVSGTSEFELTSELPDAASGTGAVAFMGSFSITGSDSVVLQVPVKNVVSYYAITDLVTVPRRTVVTADKCNACHGKLLGISDPTTGLTGFGWHDGGSNEPQVCAMCHNGNLVLPDGSSGHLKAMIHRIHKDQGANYPVWPIAKGAATGLMSGVYTGIKNCTMCHEGGSYKSDKGIQGTQDLTKAIAAITDGVISPKASTCYSCHTSATAKDHMISVGGAQFGTVTQVNLDVRLESCDSCHSASSSIAPVEKAHGQ